MKVRAWACGLMAALVGCSTVDRGFEAPRGSIPQGQVPPGVPAPWQQGNTLGAYRSPGGPYGLPPAGSPATFPQSTPTGFASAGATAGALPPGTPNLDLNVSRPSTAALASGTSPIQRISYEEKAPPPLRVIEPTAAGEPGRDSLLSDIARPLQGAETGEGDVGSRRRVMRPTNAETGDGGESVPSSASKSPTTLPDEILMAAPEPKAPRKSKASSDLVSRPEKHDASLPPGSPAVRMVNTKRIVLNYHVKDIGPSGVSTVELWYTRDGKTWQKDEGTGKAGPPYVFEVPEEGMYGFTLVARSGLGLGKKAPQRGDMPQVWVEVDLTKPVVSLLDVKHGVGAKAREISITWSATDRNLARRPITLAYSESGDGSWVPLAANIENTGHYVWNMPTTAPASFFVKVEGVDLVGNVGTVQSSKAVVIDLSQPEVQLDGVDSSEK